MAGVWARGASEKMWDPLRIFATVEASNFKFGTQLGFGTSLPKNNDLDQNWRGSGPGEHPKKCGTVEASNFKFGAIEAPKALRGCGLWRGVSLPTGEGAGPHPQKKN